MNDWTSLVEAGRSIIAATRLGGGETAGDEKFLLGDLLLAAGGLNDEELEKLASALGHGLKVSSLKSYRDVAAAWPEERRVAASWTAHRTLARHEKRFELIQPGMTLRGAQQAAGGRTSDVKHPSRWPFQERVDFVITQLQDADTNKAVREHAETRKHARSVRAAARAIEEEKSAEYREALRALRERNNAKHPERAVFEAILKLREHREFVRAVAKAATDEHSFVPEHRKPDVALALRDLAIGTIEALTALGVRDASVSDPALEAIDAHLHRLQRTRVASGFDGVVIDAEAPAGAASEHTILDAEPA